MGRILGGARLSHRTDESTSIERQTEQIQLTAKLRGDTVVHITEDTDVSGSVSPFVREGLGPWLTDPKLMCQWDTLVVAKVDRLTRSLRHFDDMVNWCDRNGKTLVSVSESLDLSTSTGRMFANLLAMFAQFERERMSERRKEAADKIRANGWWAGFRLPFGLRPVKVGDHWESERDEEGTYLILDWMADQIIGSPADGIPGKSRGVLAREMNADGIPTPFGGDHWDVRTIGRIFQNERCALDAGKLAQVLSVLEFKTGINRRHDASPLLNVAYCTCGRPLHSIRYTNKGKVYEYYKCAGEQHHECTAKRIRQDVLSARVDEAVIDAYGWVPVWHKSQTKGKSYQAEIAAIERKMHRLDQDAPDYDELHAELRAERLRLKSLPVADDFIDLTPTGMNVEAYWPTLSVEAKRSLLIENGVKVHVWREDDGSVSVVIGPDAGTLEGGEFYRTVGSLAAAG